MTILELRVTQFIREVKEDVRQEIYEIIDDTELKILGKIKNKSQINGNLFNNGKLTDKHTEIRKTLIKMNKSQARAIDLGIELIEDLEYEYCPKKKGQNLEDLNNIKIKV